jgi:glycine dehydrogenase subunit 1
MTYIPNTDADRAAMLEAIGKRSIEELFEDVPADKRFPRLNLAPALSEMELARYFQTAAEENRDATHTLNFLGAGAYQHFIPAAINHLILRGEFYSAYTPYQPEVSQGTLTAIYEYQWLICQLTGMDAANASMYDGSTALAEAVLMAGRVTKRSKVIACGAVHPEYLEVVNTYVQHTGIELQQLDFNSQTGKTEAVDEALDNQTAALVVQSPNFFGCIEDVAALAEKAHAAGALLIAALTESISLGLLRSPGSCGADIVVAEGQSFGVPLSFGGPYVGLFATREKYARQIPGRLVGEAYDKQGRRGFVLTLATREQHIRREKATSNICTNEGLIALAATVYLETMGRRGIQEVARQCAQKAAYTARRIQELEGFSLPFTAPRYNEFVVRGPIDAQEMLSRLASEKNINGGFALSRYFSDRPNDFLVCVTEINSRSEIDALVNALAASSNHKDTKTQS